MKFPPQADSPIEPSGAATRAGATQPTGRVRPRGKAETGETPRKPAISERKKAPPARKAPARGRYVDEYAHPAA